MDMLITATEKSQDWGANTLRTVTCKDCGETMEVDVPINPINFFYA
jgi:hypothetical protein